MKNRVLCFLICLLISVPCITADAADGFFYTKSGYNFEVTTSKTKYEGSTLIIAKYSQNDEHKWCEVITLQTVEFSDGAFSSGIFTMEPGYDYKYMVFDGFKPLTRVVSLNTDTSYRVENTSDDDGTPRF